MDVLSDALILSTKESMALAQVQREQTIKVAKGLQDFDSDGGVTYNEKELRVTDGGSFEWSRDE
jgi:hypothetical protein